MSQQWDSNPNNPDDSRNDDDLQEVSRRIKEQRRQDLLQLGRDLTLLQTGDGRAADRVFSNQRLQAAIRAQASRVNRRRELIGADDLVQETLLRIWSGQDSFWSMVRDFPRDTDGATLELARRFTGWARKIAYHNAISTLRRPRPELPGQASIANHADPREGEERLMDEMEHGARWRDYQANEERYVETALQALDERTRLVVTQYGAGATASQVAARLSLLPPECPVDKARVASRLVGRAWGAFIRAFMQQAMPELDRTVTARERNHLRRRLRPFFAERIPS